MPEADSIGGPLAKKPHLETRIESHQGRKKSSGHASGVSSNSREKGSSGEWCPDVLQSKNFINIIFIP